MEITTVEVEGAEHRWVLHSLSVSFSVFIHSSIPPSIYLFSYRSIYTPSDLSISLFIYLPVYLSLFYLPVSLTPCLSSLPLYLSLLSICLSSICLSIHLSICLSVHIYLSICSSIYLSICSSISLSTCSSIYLSTCSCIYLSICSSICLSICSSICLFVYSSIYFTQDIHVSMVNFFVSKFLLYSHY